MIRMCGSCDLTKSKCFVGALARITRRVAATANDADLRYDSGSAAGLLKTPVLQENGRRRSKG